MKTSFFKKYFSEIFLILFFSFLYLPIFYIIYNSLIYENKFNFFWYKSLLERSDIFYTLLNSFTVSILTVLISLTISLFGIIYLFFKGKDKVIFYFSYLGLVVPEIVLAVSLLLFFTLSKVKLGGVTLLLSHTIVGISYSFPILYGRWLEIDKFLISAAYDLGASSRQVWKTILFPLFKESLISAGVLVFILSFDDYLLSYFCGGSDFITISILLLSIIRTGFNGELAAFSSLIFLFSFLMGIFYFLFVNKNQKNGNLINLREEF